MTKCKCNDCQFLGYPGPDDEWESGDAFRWDVFDGVPKLSYSCPKCYSSSVTTSAKYD